MSSRRRTVPCHCTQCNGRLVSQDVARNHAKRDLRDLSGPKGAKAALAAGGARASEGLPTLQARGSQASSASPVAAGPSSAPSAQAASPNSLHPVYGVIRPPSPIPTHAQEIASMSFSPRFALERYSVSPASPHDDHEPLPDFSATFGPWLQDPNVPPRGVDAGDLLFLANSAQPVVVSAAANAVPLTSWTAHSPPPRTAEEQRITRAMRRAMEAATAEARREAREAATEVELDDGSGQEDFADVDCDFFRGETPDTVDYEPEDDADVDEPDPFAFTAQGEDDIGESPLHPILRVVYTTVQWLHSKWHLPIAPCNALLVIFALLLYFVGHNELYDVAASTLKTAERALGNEPEFVMLPVCPTCREVYPIIDAPDACLHCDEPLFRSSRTARSTPTPALKYPFCPISAQLRNILCQPGVEKACDAWRTSERVDGEYRDIFDGTLVRRLAAHDGSAFFRNTADCANGPDGELRLGVTWGLDWFSHITSNIAPSHSSCPTSFCLANLPIAQRYRASNLMCTSILPGPKEQTADEIQRFIRPIINDLLRLWKHGIVVKTPSCPEGRRVRVILLALVCDKPAAHKVAGYGPVSHQYFCHCCWLRSADLATQDAFREDAVDPRTNAEQRRLGDQYRGLRTSAERTAFLKEHATRYTQLSRLPYFDLVEQVVIDPMHNLALGLVKTQFYHIWVQSGILSEAKLRALHELIEQCDVPDYLGRLPAEIGVPAGGSLTADQWIILATIMGPLMVPQLWDRFMDPEDDRLSVVQRYEAKKRHVAEQAAEERAQRAEAKRLEKEQQAAARKEERARKQNLRRRGEESTGEAGRSTDEVLGPSAGDAPLPSLGDAAVAPSQPAKRKHAGGKPKVKSDEAYTMHKDDPAHFLKLSNALHLLLQHTLTDADLTEADRLLREYCADIIRLYGTSYVRPNHHYAVHVIKFTRSFGPLSGFWTFLFERLNRVLKSYKTNNRGNGDIETTFFSEFLRTCNMARSLVAMQQTEEGSITNVCASVMLRAGLDERGTVAGLSQLAEDLERPNDDAVLFQLSSAFREKIMSPLLYALVLRHLAILRPHWELYNPIRMTTSPTARPLHSRCVFYDSVVWKGRRYTPSSRAGDVRKSLACVRVPIDNGFGTRVCEIQDVIRFEQPGTSEAFVWLHVRWLIPSNPDGGVPASWKEFARVKLWEMDKYDTSSDSPPTLIDVSTVLHHVARTPVSIGEHVMWGTIGIDKGS